LIHVAKGMNGVKTERVYAVDDEKEPIVEIEDVFGLADEKYIDRKISCVMLVWQEIMAATMLWKAWIRLAKARDTMVVKVEERLPKNNYCSIRQVNQNVASHLSTLKFLARRQWQYKLVV
jgi:hypothetical protein